MKEQAKAQGKEHARSEADNLNNSRNPNASLSQQKDQVLGTAQSHADGARREGERQADQNVDQDDARRQANEKAEQAKQSVKSKIPEQHRAAVSDGINTSKQIVQDAFPEERRDQFIYRLKKVCLSPFSWS